jgi:hypothetical protein
MICTAHQTLPYLSDQIKKNEMGGTRIVYERGGRYINDFGEET